MHLERRARGRAAALLAAALALSACQPRPSAEPGAAATRGLPAETYARLADAGAEVFRLAPEGSRIDVVVRRDGALARFGHDHVIVVQAAEGLAADSGHDARADVRFALEAMAVDPADARARHGLSTTPSAEDIAGTRRNLLEASLNAARWPTVHVAARLASPLGEATEASLDIELHGQRRSLTVPIGVERTPDATTVQARFDLDQTAFGIEPYSALGGGLRVADTLELHATLRFEPAQARTATEPDPARGGMREARRSE